MTTNHELRCSYSDEDPDTGHVNVEADVVITFSFAAGSTEHWNRAIGTWLPADPCEVEFVKAEIDLGGGKREPACEVLSGWAESYLDAHQDEAAAEAWEALEDERADAEERNAECRAEMRREDRMFDRMEFGE